MQTGWISSGVTTQSCASVSLTHYDCRRARQQQPELLPKTIPQIKEEKVSLLFKELYAA